MKIIFSKKGFDTKFGGKPSPIFPDDSMVSLPIGDKKSGIKYADLSSHNGYNIGELAAELTGKLHYLSKWTAHLDPDLFDKTMARKSGWHPVLGQDGSAYGHLRNEGVGSGDLFLFYGNQSICFG